jgi:uncharacterized protein DUF3892
MSKHATTRASEIARSIDFRGGLVQIPDPKPLEVRSEDLPGGADVVNKKFTNAGDAAPGQTIVDGGGPRIAPVHVNLIFWGSAWQTDPARLQVTNGVAKILASPYMSALAQYGAATRGTLRSVITISSNPPAPTFKTSDVASFVLGLIDDEKLPEPDEDWQHLNVVMMPSTTTFASPPTNGFHTEVLWSDYDLGDVDNDQTHFAWVNYGSVSAMTAVFSHELVEAVTDPEGNGIQVAPASSNNWNEIGDICASTLTVNGVTVQSYWSGADNACVVPVFQPGNWQVTCISKSFRKDAFHPLARVGGIKDGRPFTLTQKEAIAKIDAGERFFVVGPGGQVGIDVFLHYPPGHEVFGTRYIATLPDATTADNLLSLPECP